MIRNILFFVVFSIIATTLSCYKKPPTKNKPIDKVEQADTLALENKDISIKIALKGAEIISIYNDLRTIRILICLI